MDNATFDRLTRLLAGGASRRHTLRAIIAVALGGATANEILAARKDRQTRDNDNDQKDGDRDRKDRDRDNRQGGSGGQSSRVAAQGKKNTRNKKKRKRKNKRKPNNGGGNTSCAGTPLRPGQTFLGCDFSGDTLRGQDLNSSLFKEVNLTDADLCGANLESTSFTDSDGSDANFTDVTFDSSSHDKTSYAGANLTNASFRVATFNEVDFSGADLTGADFTGATFADTEFAGAIFCRTVQPNGDVDDSGCDICDNTCGRCEDCGEEGCQPPDCCPDPETGDGVCVDTENGDIFNCGSCNRTCFTNLADDCRDGECVCGEEPECSGVETCCNGQCVNTNTDLDNCGGCNEICVFPENPCFGSECDNGSCQSFNLPDGTICVFGEADGVCCSGSCEFAFQCCTDAQCESGQSCCGGLCANTSDNFERCGSCTVGCPPDRADACVASQCVCGGNPACAEGFVCVEGSCSATS